MTIPLLDDLREGYDTSNGQPRLITAEEIQREGNPGMTVEQALAALEQIPGYLSFINGIPDPDIQTTTLVYDTGGGRLYGRNGDSYQDVGGRGNNGGGGGTVDGITESRARAIFYSRAQVNNLVAALGIGQWDNATTYPAGRLVIRVNRLYWSLAETTGDDPPDSPTQWVFIGRTEEAINDIVDREIRSQGAGGSLGRLGPYQDKLITIATATTTQSDDTFSVSLDRGEGIGAYYSWRGDEAAYSPTNTDGVLQSGGMGQLATNRPAGQNAVIGFGHLNWLKGMWHSEAAGDHTIWGRKPSDDFTRDGLPVFDEIPLIRTHGGLIQYNRAGIRGRSTADQDWVTIQRVAASGNQNATYTAGQPLTIVWESTFSRGHLYPNGNPPPGFADSSGPRHEVIVGYRTGNTYQECNNFYMRTAETGMTNLKNPSSDFDIAHEVDFWDATTYSTHDQLNNLIHNRGRLLGKATINNHIASHTRIDFPGDGGIEIVGGLVDSDGNPISTQGERGATGPYWSRILTIRTHAANADVPETLTAAELGLTIASDATFTLSSRTYTGVSATSGVGFNLSASYNDATTQAIYEAELLVSSADGSILTQDIASIVFYKVTPQEVTAGTGMTPTGLSEDEVLALIPTWGRANNPTGRAPRDRLPSDIVYNGTLQVTNQNLTNLQNQVNTLPIPTVSNEDIPTTGASMTVAPTASAVRRALSASGTIATGSIYGDAPIHEQNWDLSQNMWRYQGGTTPGSNEFVIDNSKWYKFQFNLSPHHRPLLVSEDVKGSQITTSGVDLLVYDTGGASPSFIQARRDTTNRLELQSNYYLEDPMPLRIYEIKAPKGDKGDGIPEADANTNSSSIVAYDPDAEEAIWRGGPRKTENLVDGTGNTVVLPEDYADYDVLEGMYDSDQFVGQFSIPIGYLTATASTSTIRTQGSDRVSWDRATRTLTTTAVPAEELVWIQLFKYGA